MKKLTIIFAIAAVASFFAACGDDSSSSASGNDAPGEDYFFAVKTLDDLPACMDSHEGDSVLVSSLNAIYLCNDGKWEKLDNDDLQESSSSAAKVSSSSSVNVSSSSTILSSSSEKVSSSSVTEVQEKPNWKYLNPDISYGIFQDARDGQFYKTVQIGEQVWMAENLNYDYNEGTAKSYCYNNSADSCAKYGRLYLWSAAMDSAAVFGDAGKGCGYGSTCAAGSATVVRGVCPEGWHLPSNTEWKILFATIGGKDFAGILLKSKSGWDNYAGESGNGTDGYGFSVLPAGDRDGGGSYDNAGERARSSGVLRGAAAIVRTSGASTTAASTWARVTTTSTTVFPSVASGTLTRGGVGPPLLAAA
ncbi:fibrobacter succinogenes major paralogous domain-containing protein [Fibrobacter intestinalis]|uniref:Major paralogous domain-containing protein n=1 Tax=Fibrobacter intestinalis TaxID=28122 RepID=A0A1T4RVM3_9BACT|nr:MULTISPECIES: fibrobacter succinogenes major paralogous domain-containing protein [Fibrobacter]PBC73606.1 uncharacterized protein (TIGR02145 family) [Fibrobacter sp. NR9]SKA19788.1 major paralogous domain-containing protein [Fibrobacter intestinalis]